MLTEKKKKFMLDKKCQKAVLINGLWLVFYSKCKTIFVITIYLFCFCIFFFAISLQKQAYLNILKILQPNKETFQIKKKF